jgi:hypothetical protein
MVVERFMTLLEPFDTNVQAKSFWMHFSLPMRLDTPSSVGTWASRRAQRLILPAHQTAVPLVPNELLITAGKLDRKCKWTYLRESFCFHERLLAAGISKKDFPLRQ